MRHVCDAPVRPPAPQQSPTPPVLVTTPASTLDTITVLQPQESKSATSSNTSSTIIAAVVASATTLVVVAAVVAVWFWRRARQRNALAAASSCDAVEAKWPRGPEGSARFTAAAGVPRSAHAVIVNPPVMRIGEASAVFISPSGHGNVRVGQVMAGVSTGGGRAGAHLARS